MLALELCRQDVQPSDMIFRLLRCRRQPRGMGKSLTVLRFLGSIVWQITDDGIKALSDGCDLELLDCHYAQITRRFCRNLEV